MDNFLNNLTEYLLQSYLHRLQLMYIFHYFSEDAINRSKIVLFSLDCADFFIIVRKSCVVGIGRRKFDPKSGNHMGVRQRKSLFAEKTSPPHSGEGTEEDGRQILKTENCHAPNHIIIRCNSNALESYRHRQMVKQALNLLHYG